APRRRVPGAVRRRGGRGPSAAGGAQGTQDDRRDGMKIAAMNEVRARFAEFLQASQEGHVIVTSHGKPVAMIVGVKGQALDSLILRRDAVGARILAERRKGPFVPFEQVESLLGLERPRKRTPAKKRR